MKSSYEKINYALRPAKNIERKMILESLQRLTEFGRLDAYRYVGFGSPFYSDFSLLHRQLGLRTMISIEEDTEKAERFVFNKPFGCIRLILGDSNDVLPGLDWDQRSIVWLDYDGKLDAAKLADVRTVVTSAASGSVLIVTVNSQPDSLEENRLELFEKRLGSHNVPLGTKSSQLEGWELAMTSRIVIGNSITDALNDRNGALQPEHRFDYKQIYNFQYSDGARMLTVGGVLHDGGHAGKFAACDFDSLNFVSMNDEPFSIPVPSLTFREMRHLDEQLPIATELPTVPDVPEEDVERYAELYRYFPKFVDAEL